MTNKELIKTLNQIVANIGSKTTKVEKKLFRIFEQLDKYRDDLNLKINDLKLEHASCDADGHLLYESNGEYRYKKAEKKSLDVALLNLANAEVENFKPVSIVNPQGLEKFDFLSGWVNGIEFVDHDDHDAE